jgi:branched-chain amino acid transport system substrate-binding protein
MPILLKKILIIQLIGLCFAQTSLRADVIKIGEVGSMTGSEATFGISTHEGIELAISKQNSSGGVKGKKLELIALDNQGKPEEAAIATRKLITQDKVVALLGEVSSSRSLAMAPIAQKYKIPMISPSSTNPKVTAIGDYIFRVCFTDPFQGSVMAKFALETLRLRKLAILRDVKSDYSMGVSDFFREYFLKRGGEIVVEQTYSAGDVDFNSQLTSIRAKKPDSIFIPGFYTEVGLIVKQARKLGIKSPILGADGWDSEKLYEIGGKSLNKSYFSNHYRKDDQSPAVQKFVNDYKAVYKKAPDGAAALGYDAALVLIAAMKNAETVSPKEIRDGIANTKDFPAVTGKITIDENRNASKPAVILEIKDGKFLYKSSVDP